MSAEKIDVVSPFDGKHIGCITRNTEVEAEQMLAAAYAAYQDKSKWLKHHQRIDIINKLAVLVEKEADKFAMLIAQEGGKPLADAKVETARAIDGIKLAAKELMSIAKGTEIPMGFTKPAENRLAFTVQEPMGVVLSISAFNHPLNLTMHQVIPAVAVGCPVIIKPATKTPLCCLRFIELLHEAGLPKVWAQAILCDNKVAEKLVADNRVSFFNFIGSSAVGWNLRNKLAPGTRYALEHGGSAAVVVDKHIDNVDTVVSSVVKGGFYHAGQVCISVQRVFVHNDLLKEFSDKLAKAASRLKVGDPTMIDTEVGPLISTKEVDRVESWINEAVKEGATLLTGGKRITDTTFEATILLNPSQKSKVSTLEVFGPVVCVYGYNTLDEAINLANSPNLPFQSAVFSNNLDSIMKLFYHLDAAAVIVNDHSAFRVDWMPFAGRRSAGAGIGGVPYAMHEMMHHKMAIIKSPGIVN